MKSFFEPIVSYNKTFSSICCFSPMILMLYILIVDRSNMSEIIVVMIILALFCCTLMGLFHFLLKNFFEEYIRIDNNKIIHIGPKLNGQKKTTIPISEPKSILWENESFAVFIGSRNSIYLIDKDSNKHTIVKDKISAFLSINRVSFDKLSEILKVPIHQEFYVMSSDLKQRRKA